PAGVASFLTLRLSGDDANDSTAEGGGDLVAKAYIEVIMDHAANPRNFGELNEAEVRGRELNPLCGDVVEIMLKLDGGGDRVEKSRFIGQGCAVSQAFGSMLAEMLDGKPMSEVRKLDEEAV